MGSAPSAIGTNASVFYDNEILAIIQRTKAKSSGLVDTKVWGWIGKDANLGPKEEKALADLAKRYGTKLVGVVLFPPLQHKLKFDHRFQSGSTTSLLIWSQLSEERWPSAKYVEGPRFAL